MFSHASPEQRIPKDHPLRAIRALVDEVLNARFSRRFELRTQDSGSFNYQIGVFSEWRRYATTPAELCGR
jgi:hypothetical protein